MFLLSVVALCIKKNASFVIFNTFFKGFQSFFCTFCVSVCSFVYSCPMATPGFLRVFFARDVLAPRSFSLREAVRSAGRLAPRDYSLRVGFRSAVVVVGCLMLLPSPLPLLAVVVVGLATILAASPGLGFALPRC